MPNLSRALTAGVAVLAVILFAIVIVSRRSPYGPTLPAPERASQDGLSRAMTFSPPAEPKR